MFIYKIVDKIVIEINEKINSLLDEIKKLMKKVDDNKLALEKEHRNLKNKLVLKQILEILKSVGLIINGAGSVVSPIGIACNVIIKGAHIAESFISEDNNKVKFEIPPEIKVSLEKMEKMVESKGILKYKIEIESQLEELSQECNKHPNFSNIKTKIQKLLKNINSNAEKLELKKNENITTSQKTKAELEIIQTFNTAIKKIEITLDSLTASIEQADDDIKKLMQYEDNINHIIVSMIKRMQNDIYNIETKIDKKSYIFLDLTEWQVQTSLKDIKYNIQQISGGFEAQKDITYYMEKLDEGITTLIKIYDRIQDYYDQANLARYIANIHSPKITKIEDKKLNNAINDLNLKIRTNLIL
ncbi:32419_t:CDS:2 [Gigaspora margarita]|uniref:32419_t:CDS:1 n=1 Tax=Gigaspora margarita TaxID=4874 RepID=A0ABN7UJN9_GIGMA|nr:32419_t:CDS:2 [Gigaspora margarita]